MTEYGAMEMLHYQLQSPLLYGKHGMLTYSTSHLQLA